MPKVTITLPGAPSAHTQALIKKRGTDSGGVVEWNVQTQSTLTDAEIIALRRKHKTQNINLQRAEDVKRLMAEGMRCKDICARLRRQYGERMIKTDHATLSRIGEGLKRR
jgi:DNA-binding NarL/FixJ family response regulator